MIDKANKLCDPATKRTRSFRTCSEFHHVDCPCFLDSLSKEQIIRCHKYIVSKLREKISSLEEEIDGDRMSRAMDVSSWEHFCR